MPLTIKFSQTSLSLMLISHFLWFLLVKKH